MNKKKEEMKIATLSKELGRSYQTFYNTMMNESERKPEKFQVIPHRRWTTREEGIVLNIRRGETRDVAKMLNRSIQSIRQKIHILKGLR